MRERLYIAPLETSSDRFIALLNFNTKICNMRNYAYICNHNRKLL